MNNLKWFFPLSGSECLNLFNDGFRPHGGGTFLIKTALSIDGLFTTATVDEYRKISESAGLVKAGSASTYAEAASFFAKIKPGNIISSSLSRAASTPLRNRITVGGSIASSPKWTDTAASFAASGASVALAGEDAAIDFIQYASNRDLRKNSLVSSVIIPLDKIEGGYYRFTLTGFDYPFFTAAVSLRENGTMVAAVSGCRDGLKLFSGSAAEVAEQAEAALSFSAERGLSGEYLKNRALTELARLTGGSADE